MNENGNVLEEITNYGPTTEVRIIQRWDGNRPAINRILRDFRRYLIQEKIDNNVAEGKWSRAANAKTTTPIKRLWIEILLDTPIEDYRKYAIRRIIAPYLINVRKLAYDDAFNIMKNWLNNCDQIKPLDFNANIKINRRCQVPHHRVGLRRIMPEQFLDVAAKVLPKLKIARVIGKAVWGQGGDIRDVISIGKLVRKSDGPEEVEKIISTMTKYGELKEHY
jgi:hypothetical protein